MFLVIKEADGYRLRKWVLQLIIYNPLGADAPGSQGHGDLRDVPTPSIQNNELLRDLLRRGKDTVQY